LKTCRLNLLKFDRGPLQISQEDLAQLETALAVESADATESRKMALPKVSPGAELDPFQAPV